MLLVGLQTGSATMENSMEVPQKIKNIITIWSSNPISGCISKGNKNRILKRYLHSHIYCIIIYNSQNIETEQLHFHFSLSCIGEGNGNPLQCPCLENPRDRGASWAAVYGVAQSRTRLKRLSSSRDTLSFYQWISG